MDAMFDERFSVSRSSRYATKHKIGEGAFGEVRLGVEIQTGTSVAIKYVRLGGRGEAVGIPRAVFREMEALKQLKSPHIVKMIDVYPSETNLALVFEYMVSDIEDVITNSEAPLPTSTIKYLSHAIFKGIEHCHSRNIIHRDIKPSNILLNDKGQVKIADFGLARILDTREGAASMSHQVATRWYRAPEILFGARRYTAAVDVWAVGAVVAELMSLAPLFPGTNDIDQIFKVFQVLGTPTEENWPDADQLPDFNKISFPAMLPLSPQLLLPSADPAARSFVLQFLCLNPTTRLTSAEAIHHPYLEDAPSFHPLSTKFKFVAQTKTKTKGTLGKRASTGGEEIKSWILGCLGPDFPIRSDKESDRV